MDDSAGKRKRNSPIQAAGMRARNVEHETGRSDELVRRCILEVCCCGLVELSEGGRVEGRGFLSRAGCTAGIASLYTRNCGVGTLGLDPEPTYAVLNVLKALPDTVIN